MKNRKQNLAHLASTIIVFATISDAAEIVKENNTNALNFGTAWVGGTGPTTSDVGLWNNTVSATNAASSPTITALGGDLSWQGIKITNVGGTANTSTTTSGVQITNGSSANTLTLGTAGIDMSAATQALMVQSKITLAGNQTWSVTNANTNGGPFAGSGVNAGLGEDLMFAAQAAATMNLGGFTLGTSGTGAIGVSSGYAISNGTLNLANSNTWLQSGSSRLTSLASNLSVTVAANSNLRLRANSGGINSAAPISVSGTGSKLQMEINNGTASMIQSGNLTFGNGSTLEHLVNNSGAFTVSSPTISTSGTITWLVNGTNAGPTNGVAFSGGLTGNGTIAYRNTATGTNGQVRLSGDNSLFTGSITLDGSSGNRSLRLTSGSAGSGSAIWAVNAANILQVDGVAVNLGTLNGAGNVTNSHATNTAAISVGAGSFSGVISNGTPANGMALTKTGVGTLTLTGANTYSGLTNIQAGTLATTSAQIGAGAFTVADSATFSMTQVSAADTFNISTLNLATTGGSTLELTPATSPTAALLTIGTLNVNAATTLRIKGLPENGTTLISYTTLGGGSGFGGLSLVMPFRINGTLNNTGSAITLNGISDETPKWRVANGVWDINTTNNWKTSTTSTTTNYLQGGVGATDSVIFDDTATGASPITVTLNTTVSPVAISVLGAKDYIISGTGGIVGTTGIVKNGISKLTLATANTFSAGVQLNEGTLEVNHPSALGSGMLTIDLGTTLDNSSGAPITCSPAVTSTWAGSFIFSGTNDLNLVGNVTIVDNPVVTVATGTLGVGGISGNGINLTKDGNGTLVIGASSYTGSTSVLAGTLKANAAAAFNNTSSMTLEDNTVTLDLNGFNQTVNTINDGGVTSGNVILGGGILTTSSGKITNLTGPGGMIKNGGGSFEVLGAISSFNGASTINGGILDVGNDINNLLDVSGVLTINNGAVLQGSGSINRTVGNGNAVVSGNGGFAARGGQLDVNLDEDPVAAGSHFNFASSANRFGGALVLGSTTADNKVRILNSIGINNFNATRTISVISGIGTATGELAGIVSNGPSTGNNGINKTGDGELILSALNTYTGDTIVNAGSVTLAATGQLTFRPTANGTINKIKGLGSASLNGMIDFDLSAANTTSGNAWKIVDDTPSTGLTSNTIGATFSVVGFDDTDADDVWIKVVGAYQWTFTEATRELTVMPAPGFAGWIGGTFANGTVPLAQRDKTADPDGDGISNLLEYAIAGLDPTVANALNGTFNNNVLSFTKRLPLDATLIYKIEESIDLGGTVAWTEVPTGAAYTNDGTTISYNLPTSLPRNFVRLNVTCP